MRGATFEVVVRAGSHGLGNINVKTRGPLGGRAHSGTRAYQVTSGTGDVRGTRLRAGSLSVTDLPELRRAKVFRRCADTTIGVELLAFVCNLKKEKAFMIMRLDCYVVMLLMQVHLGSPQPRK